MKQLLIYSLIYGCGFVSQSLSAQTPEELYNSLPIIEHWVLSPDKEVFHRENLYERINGAAPLFLENNFQEMTTTEYTRGDDYITIQAYRHATPEDAFGMYASERSSDMTFYEGIGGEAQGDGYGLFFFAGSMYVKMTASDETEDMKQILLNIAQSFSEKIDAEAAYPKLFASFPAEGLIPHTQTYISKNYIGHEFLNPAYTANYNYQGRKIQLFIIAGKTAENTSRILLEYFTFTKQKKEELSEGKLLIEDRYNGNIPAVWKGQYIIGAFDENGEDFAEDIYSVLQEVSLIKPAATPVKM
ncbi:MAG: hypothetical protein EZS26_000107 [Candidatus Ordinivivax streblomastigis]|uniref:Uncharacterized protein n=1 Tax=Candidatus Ordinivivax streblomastigis TaxID=2540710 RepID=A0A5M8P5L6_9BACT|nr:MAG: hypothetical protein EZS26_000107 [Candidatus Ordinivivax streblomastigis]